MSVPANDEGAPPAPAPPPKRRPRRWLDSLNVLLVCSALGLVVISASPAILRAAGVAGPNQENVPRPAGRLSLPRGGGESQERRFVFAPPDDEDDAHQTELEREYPDGMWPGRRTAEERRRDRELFPGRGDPSAEPDRPAPRVHDPTPGGEGRARFGVVRRKITLVEKPGAGGRSLGEVQPGQTVMVIKEAGDFALIAYSSQDGVLMGWTKKSEITVR